MTIVLYADDTLYTDSRKLNFLQSEKNPIAITGQKIRLFAGGTMAYASCGTDLPMWERDSLELNLKSLLFSAWLAKKVSKGIHDPRYQGATTIWLRDYSNQFAEPLDPITLIAMTKDLVLNVQYEGVRYKAHGSCNYLDITGEDGHVLAASPAAFHIYRRCGMTTVGALKKIIDTSPLCDYPIQMQSRESLEDHNFEGFIDYMLKQDSGKQKAKGAK